MSDTAQLPGPVEPDRPYIGAFCFSETDGYGAAQATRLAETGQVFVTEFAALSQSGEPGKYTGSLIAVGWGAAEEEAKRRGLGERVVGKLGAVRKAPDRP